MYNTFYNTDGVHKYIFRHNFIIESNFNLHDFIFQFSVICTINLQQFNVFFIERCNCLIEMQCQDTKGLSYNIKKKLQDVNKKATTILNIYTIR